MQVKKNFSSKVTMSDKSVVRVVVQADSAYDAAKMVRAAYPDSKWTWPVTSAWNNDAP